MSQAWGGRKVATLTALVLGQYGTTCHLCLEPIALTLPRGDKRGPSVDHLVPRSKGGTDELANLRPAHRSCNSRRGDRALTAALLASFRRRRPAERWGAFSV